MVELRPVHDSCRQGSRLSVRVNHAALGVLLCRVPANLGIKSDGSSSAPRCRWEKLPKERVVTANGGVGRSPVDLLGAAHEIAAPTTKSNAHLPTSPSAPLSGFGLSRALRVSGSPYISPYQLKHC